MSSDFTYGFKASNYGIRRQGIFRLVISLAVIAWALWAFSNPGNVKIPYIDFIIYVLPFYALYLVGDTLYRFFRYPAIVAITDEKITYKPFFTTRSLPLREDNVEFGLQVRPIMPSFRSYKAVKITRAPGFFGYFYLIGSERIALREMINKDSSS
ncbi:MAG: hypothetical protein GY771_08730 [bacterium]|nr:hypothetical protein [bacterium]